VASSLGRDIVLDILAKDDTSKGTKSAGSNFDTLKKKVDGVSASGSSMGTKFKSGISALAGPAAAVGGALLAFGVAAGKAASDAQQSLGATQAIFGKTADSIIAKSNEAATKYGLSANEYRNSANIIGSLFKNQGVAQDQLGGKTDDMIKKASDLAAVFGGTTADAVDALSSAFKGEFDPLEKYGISIKQSTVSTEAMRLAGVKTTKDWNKLTDAQKRAYTQQATANLINKQSASTQGQFAAQTSTSAEKLQIVKAKFANLSAELGEKLLPVFNKVLDVGTKILAWMEKHKTLVTILAIVIGSLVVVTWALNIAMLANPVGLIIAGIVALIAVIVYVATKTQFFQTIWQAVWGFFKAVGAWFAGPFVDFFKTAWSIIVDGFKAYVGIWMAIGKSIWDFFKAIGAWFSGPFVDFFKKVGKAIANWASDVWKNITDKWNAVINFVKGLPGKITAATKGMWDGIKNAFRAAINWIIDKWNGLHFTIPGVDTHIPGIGKIGGFTLNTPDIPRLAEGGIVKARSGGTAAVIAEAGRDEVVAPLDKLQGYMQPPVIHIYIGDREITDIVQVEIAEQNRQTRRSYRAGAGARIAAVTR